MSLNPNLKTIFAIKVKRLRKQRGLTLGEMSETAGVSASYLAEIEGGKKYPKPDRIVRIAGALGCSYDDLVSSRLESDFDELHSLISAPVIRDFPFAFFGISASDVVKLLARAPLEVTALIRTLNEVARQYDIGVEHLLHATLRSFLELTENGYPDIDVAAEGLARKLAGSRNGAWERDTLRQWLFANGIATIDEETLANQAPLRQFRSVLVNTRPARLLLNPLLSEAQKVFVLAREAGYRVLGLTARSFTAPPDREDSFDQVRNDFQASYFAGALLMPRKAFSADLRAFFKLPTWQPAVLLSLLSKYHVTAETLMHRISQIMPTAFGLHAHFLKFSEEGARIRMVKLVNLSGLPMLSGAQAKEQYCRRWLATRLLSEFRAAQRTPNAITPHAGAQYSQFVDSDKIYFNFGMALPQPLRPETVITLTVGCKADDRLAKTIHFATDPSVPRIVVSSTCERCRLGPESCAVRVAPPMIYLRDKAKEDARQALESLAHRSW
jgi:transcriptional regulator with XRE-family HTH domain